MSKKCLLIYFSQGGTTRTISSHIQTGLEESGWSVTPELLSLDTPSDVSDYDMIGIGLPTYFYKPPFIVTEYLDRLSGVAGKPFFVFVLYGTYIGDAGNWTRRTLTHKQGREIGYQTYLGEDMFLGYLREGVLFSPDTPRDDEKNNAVSFGKALAGRAEGGPYSPPAPDPRPKFVNRLERFFLTPYLFRHAYSRFFKVDSETCLKCGICQKVCPSQNIQTTESGLPVFGNNCIGCINCEMKCPVEAIRSPFAWGVARIFLKINVFKASKDPSIAQARVVHRNGRIHRVD